LQAAAAALPEHLANMRIASGVLSRDQYLQAIEQVVEYLRSHGIRDLLVAYGWGCDCPEEQLWQDLAMPLERLQSFIAESEASSYYRVGKNDLHVKDPSGQWEFLFCHESDIHFTTEDEGLFAHIRAVWIANGYKDVYEKRGADWQRVAINGR
jgi:hypothetical protein